MKSMITDCLAARGWQKDSIVDAFSKTFETVVAPKKASIWLSFERQFDRWWLTNGDFTSAGENVLATCHAFFPTGMALYELQQAVEALVSEMEYKIAGAYSVRLLRHRDGDTSV